MASKLPNMRVTQTVTEVKTKGNDSTTFSTERKISNQIREFAHLYRKVAAAYNLLLEFKSAPTESGVQFDSDNVQYVRITNLDDSADAALALVYGEQISGAVGTFSQKLRAGESFIMGNPIDFCYEAEGAPQRDILQIKARGLDGETPDLEIVIASN